MEIKITSPRSLRVPVVAVHSDGVGIFERRLSAHQFDVMKLQILQDALAFHFDDCAFVVHEIVDSEIVFQGIVDAIEPALLQSGKIQSGFAQGLAGYGAGVDAASTYGGCALNDRDSLAEIGSLGAGLFSGRAAANHDQIK